MPKIGSRELGASNFVEMFSKNSCYFGNVAVSKQVVLGIEGGGTKTEWLCVETSASGTSQRSRGHLPAANLRLLSDSQLEHILGVLSKEATHVGVFLAGCASSQDRQRLSAIVEKMWPHATRRIGSDRDSGFAAAFADADGIAVIAGTGSAVTGRRNGAIEKAGGWGHLLGDVGSGYQLAVEGLRRTLHAYDLDRQITPLASDILQALSLNQLDELVQWVMHADKMSVAKLAPVIFQAARTGDQQMLAAIKQAAGKLAEYTVAVAERLELRDPDVSLMGGLFANHPEYAEFYQQALLAQLPGARVALCQKTGAEGAVYLAAALHAETGRPEENLNLADVVTEQSNPRSTNLESMSVGSLVDLFISEEAAVQEALASCRKDLVGAVDLVSAALGAGGRLFYVGAGTSGRLGVLDASEIPPTFGTSPDLIQGLIAGGVSALYKAAEGAEDQAELGAVTLMHRGVISGDIVCGITASGRTPFVLGALRKANALGAKTMLITCNPNRTSGHVADICIDLPTGPEVLTGSTRLKAGTATKVALNILSTASMVRLGKVHGNVMSNLKASNAKLRDRAVRAVSTELGCNYQEAKNLLVNHDWNLRTVLNSRGTGPGGKT